jgi:hypothetical protein
LRQLERALETAAAAHLGKTAAQVRVATGAGIFEPVPRLRKSKTVFDPKGTRP